MQALRTSLTGTTRNLLAATIMIAAAIATENSIAGPPNYLIVAAEVFADAAPTTQLANARIARGFNVTTYSVPPGSSIEDIRTYIRSWYTPGDPAYIVIIGDSSGLTSTAYTIPHCTGGGWHSSVTDLPYACMDAGDDWYPEAAIGRLSVSTMPELQSIVAKTIDVESGTYSDPDYTKRAAFLATGDSSPQAEDTHEWVIANYFDPAGFTSTRIYASQGGDTDDISAAVNNGSLFNIYIGHSGYTSWWDPSFNNADVTALTNERLYGLVLAISCGTANFAWTYGDCLAETWTRSPNKGSAAYIGTTDLIYSAPPDTWESVRRLYKYFFEACFTDNKWEVGPAWQAACYGLLNDPDYGPDHDHTRDYFEMFILLGDPALILPHEQPINGDFDQDNDVDLADFAKFQECYGEYATGPCLPGNLAGGKAIDRNDYNLFQPLLTGP